jgi:hypothetical protein
VDFAGTPTRGVRAYVSSKPAELETKKGGDLRSGANDISLKPICQTGYNDSDLRTGLLDRRDSQVGWAINEIMKGKARCLFPILHPTVSASIRTVAHGIGLPALMEVMDGRPAIT